MLVGLLTDVSSGPVGLDHVTPPEATSEPAEEPQSRREANVEARRERILESARALLSEFGPVGLSMRKLAREADLSVTTLYNLVGSREEILQALIDDSAGRLEASAPKASRSRDPLRRAARALERVLQYIVDHGALMRPLIVADFSTGYWEKLGQHDQGKHFTPVKGVVHECVAEALASGQLRGGVSLSFLETQLYVAWELALDRWAFGFLDDESFRLKSLAGF